MHSFQSVSLCVRRTLYVYRKPLRILNERYEYKCVVATLRNIMQNVDNTVVWWLCCCSMMMSKLDGKDGLWCFTKIIYG